MAVVQVMAAVGSMHSTQMANMLEETPLPLSPLSHWAPHHAFLHLLTKTEATSLPVELQGREAVPSGIVHTYLCQSLCTLHAEPPLSVSHVSTTGCLVTMPLRLLRAPSSSVHCSTQKSVCQSDLPPSSEPCCSPLEVALGDIWESDANQPDMQPSPTLWFNSCVLHSFQVARLEKAITDTMRPFHRTNGLWVHPKIPKRKLRAIRRSACVPLEDTIVCLYDDTWLGGARNGFAFTNTGFYVYNGDGPCEGQHCVKWQEVLAARYSPRLRCESRQVQLSASVSVQCTIASRLMMVLHINRLVSIVRMVLTGVLRPTVTREGPGMVAPSPSPPRHATLQKPVPPALLQLLSSQCAPLSKGLRATRH